MEKFKMTHFLAYMMKDKGSGFQFVLLGLVIAVLGSIPYFFSIIPNSFYNLYSDIMFLLLLGLILLTFTKVKRTFPSLKYFNYGILLMFIATIFRLFSDLGIIPVSLSVILIAIAYVTILASALNIFSDVFIPKQYENAAIATMLVIFIIALAFQFHSFYFSGIPSLQKIYYLLIQPADLIMMLSTILLVIIINSKLFLKVYGWLILAFILLFISDFFGVGSRVTVLHNAWDLRDVLVFIVYLCFINFIRQHIDVNLEEFFKPAKIIHKT